LYEGLIKGGNKMKQRHKINLQIVWAGTIILSSLALVMRGFTAEGIKAPLVMLTASVLATFFYFIPMDDIVKGVLLTLTIALATLGLSIISGGSAVTFICSMVVYGFVLLYAKRKIMIWYSSIYIGICLIAAIVNPIYISMNGLLMDALAYIVLYGLLGVLLSLAIGREEEKEKILMKQAEEKNEQAIRFLEISKKLNDTIIRGKQGNEEVNCGVADIEDATIQLASAVEETSKSIVTVSENVNESKENMDEINELTEKLKEQFQKMVYKVDEGNESGALVETSMRKVTEAMNAADQETNLLIEETKKIFDILKQINSIATQTNLLALNASIEAARAGEAGKGFSVVAEQIRILSEGSKHASENINSILSSFSSMICGLSEKMEYSTKSVEDGNAKLEGLLLEVNAVKDSATDVNMLLDTETSLIQKATSKFTKIGKEIENIVSISEENTAMIINIASTVEQQRTGVQGVVNEFEGIMDLSNQLIEKEQENII